jgi:hypothetical protein
MLRKPADSRIPFRALPWLPLATVVALLSACASIPPPTGTMSRAQASVQAAQRAGAADADPVDLEFARGKLQQAQQALSAGKNAQAASLAQESLADSHLALTKARLATMRGKVDAQRKENARLNKQLLEQPAKSAAPASAGSSSVQELPQMTLSSPAASSSTPAPAATTEQGGQ